ncbi:MAG TPA: hypothetical protein VFD60_13070, partial [Nitrososphaeraceae archaeon]|nr:hypothetical protein [Nitrososphaeraceae archaeon]
MLASEGTPLERTDTSLTTENEESEPKPSEGRKLNESKEEEVKVTEGDQELKVLPENEEEE